MNVFRRLLRRADASPAEIWRGVYRSFSEAPGSIEGHASTEWIDALTSDMAAVRRGAWDEDFIAEHDQLLLLVFALGGARILDYGGGVGQTYEYLRRVLPMDIGYELIEIPEVAELARRMHPDDAGIRVRSDLGQELPDIVFVKGVLQYIDDHQQILRRLFALGARFVVLEKFSGVAGPSYVTEQLNVSSTPIPYRFIAFDEVFAIAREAGYQRLVWRRLPRVYDQSTFPAESRMGQASTLVFGRRIDAPHAGAR